jgi:hypothetical protein
MKSIDLITKEHVSGIQFDTQDAITDPIQRKVRSQSLYHAMLLGNGYKGKVRIVFRTIEGIKAVETTVWQAGEQQISLKGGIHIPVKSIIEVSPI